MASFKRLNLTLLLFAIILLSGCADFELPDASSSASPAEQARQYERAGNFQKSADLYWLASQRAPAGQDVLLKLKAAEMAYQVKNFNQVRAITAKIDERGLAKPELVRKRLVEAKVARQRGDEATASRLTNIPPQGLAPALQQELARFQRGETDLPQTLSAADRSKLHGLMLQHQRSNDNNDAGLVWYELLQIQNASIRGWIANSKDPLILGWLELANLAQNASDSARWQQDNAVWQRRHPKHPAFPGDPATFVQRGAINARVIAILLPRSRTSPLARAGQVILNGISTAHRSINDGTQPEIRVYDSAENPQDIYKIYATAADQGAELVIGPFDKQAVETLARQRLSVPVLALNHTISPELYNPNLFQFGLIPEDEAKSAAENMYQDGYTNIIAFAPETDWGQRVAAAFTETFTELGGVVVETGLYDGRANDYSDTIVRVLQVEKGEQRHTGSRREDVEAIFVAGNSRQARIFKPLLDFHFAEDLAVYTTSSVYSGIPKSDDDRDLNGINYLEMPWLLNLDPDPQDIVPKSEELIGDDRAYPRLFAFGVDAYRLAPFMRQLNNSPDAVFNGYTGEVYAGEANKLRHRLPRATFNRGLTQTVPLDPNTREMNYDLVQEKLTERAERLALEAEEKLLEAEKKAKEEARRLRAN